MSLPTATRTYIVRTMAFMTGYVAVNVAAISGAFDDMAQPARWVLAAAVAAPVAGQIWATLAYMRDADEYFRAMLAKQYIIAAGLAMALFSAWGFAESYAGAPHAPGWLVYPLFWAAYAVVAPFVATSRA